MQGKNPANTSKLPLHYSGFAVLLIYIGFCAWYYLERVCYADSAHMLFKIIQSGSFNIEAGRYPQIITQIPVFMALKFEPSLNFIVLLYSLSFPIFFASCAIVSYYKYHNKWAPALLVFALIGSVNYGFFHCATETHQSIAWGLLFYSWMMNPRVPHENELKNLPYLVSGLAFAVLAMHSHPVGFFFIIFSIGYFFTERKEFKNPIPYIVLALIAILSIYKTSSTDATSYEGQFLSLIPQFPELIADFSNNWSWDYFIEESDKTYMLLWIAFFTGVFWMISRKKFLRLAYYVAFNLGFLLFTLLIYHKGDSYLMMERAFMPLAFTLAAPIFDLFSESTSNRTQYIQLAGLGLIFLLAFNGVQKKGNFMSSRLSYIDEIHQQLKADKICLRTNQVDMYKVQVPWPFCFESLLYSGSKYGKEGCFTISILNETEYEEADKVSADNLIVPSFFGGLSIYSLNKKYFDLAPGAYVLKTD